MRKRSLFIGWLGLLALAGCGGGGGDMAATTGGQDFSAGAVSGRASGASRVSTINGAGNCSFFAITGATFSRVLYSPPRVLANTRISFDTQYGNLWSCDPSGGHMNEISVDMGRGYAAISGWSPDASQLCFLGNKGNGYGYYVIGATGAGERALGAASADYSYPAWNPVASVIAYDDYDSLSGHSQIFTIPVGGGSPTRISDGTNNDEFPSYTSNGSKIAFLRFADRNVYTMNANGTSVTQISSGGAFYRPSISPDGTRIAAERNDGTHSQIAVVNVATGIFSGITSDAADHYRPTWSPDGRMLLYTQLATGTQEQLVVSTADGTIKNTILADPNTNYDYPCWSPFPGPRTMVGTGGLFGTSARAGFMYSQVGDSANSFLTFSAPTPAGVTITSEAPGTGGQNELFQIEGGGGLTALSYANDLYVAPFAVIPNQMTTANGAVVSMNIFDGHVSMVVPYTKMTSKMRTKNGTVYIGQFLGVYDDKGHNLAPNGATRVVL